MRFFKKHDFGKVCAWELGWSPMGRPLMTTLCYRVGSIFIDTGQSHMRPEVMRAFGEKTVEAVLLTHYHEDHSGNAAALQSRFNVPVYASAQTAQKLSAPYRIFPYQHLIWGPTKPLRTAAFPAELEIDGITVIPVSTPGHSRDHVSYLVSAHGLLFSGDLYLSERIKYFRADERIDDQIISLKKVLTLDFDALFCGHHPRPKDGKRHISEKLGYLEDFYGSVATLAEKGMDASQIMKMLGLKEQTLVKIICFGNVSMKNMVLSVVRSLSIND
jgi:glyoxylase-like metal-dependent hydrolase (beta-lactamase superfamily II)